MARLLVQFLSLISLSILELVFTSKGVGGFTSPSTSTTTRRWNSVKSGDDLRKTKPNYKTTIRCYGSKLDDYTTYASEGVRSTLLSNEVQEELQSQNPNEDAPAYDYFKHQNGDGDENSIEYSSFFPMTELDKRTLDDNKHAVQHSHFETRSLDDLFPNQQLGLSEKFNFCAPFRNELRVAIRHDMIFDSNADNIESIANQPPIYSQMTDEQRYQENAENKPLIGYWKHDNKSNTTAVATTDTSRIRMKKTTEVLSRYLGPEAPSGDSFMEAIGSLCNSTQAPYHWTEVVGVAATQNNQMGDKTEHAWHQDYGHLQDREVNTNDRASAKGGMNSDGDSYPYQSNNHVFFAFPFEDNYNGTGVFSHLIKLKYEQWAKPKGDPTAGKSIFYGGTVPDRYIVRPLYSPGNELFIFRDIDVLHSTPDIQYRTSIMRFG